jgi:hypothetical protein
MLSSLVFRAIRDALPGNPAAQERILGASLLAMAIADVSHLHDHPASQTDSCMTIFLGNPVSSLLADHFTRSEHCCQHWCKFYRPSRFPQIPPRALEPHDTWQHLVCHFSTAFPVRPQLFENEAAQANPCSRVAWFWGIGRTRYYFGQGSRLSSGRAKDS